MAGYELGPADQRVNLVFIHANGFNALTYRTLLAPVAAAGHRILGIDLRGHGLTRLPTVTDGRRHWSDMGDDLAALVVQEGLSDVVIAGHSIGATTSLLGAAQIGGRVRSMVLTEPVTHLPAVIAAGTAGEPQDGPLVQGALKRRTRFASRQAAFDAFKGRGAFRSWPDEVLTDYLTDGLTEQEDGEFELACAPAWEVSNYLNQNHDIWAALSATTCPVHILRGTVHSTFQMAPLVNDLVATGRLKLTTVEGASHFLPMEHPDVVRRALLNALG